MRYLLDPENPDGPQYRNPKLPGYEPPSEPNLGTGGAGTGGAAAPPDWSTGPWDANRVRDYFSSRGVAPRATSPDYWAGKYPELSARGQELGNPNYFMDRLSKAEEFGGGGGGGTFDTPGLQNWEGYLNEMVNRLRTPQNNPALGPFQDYLKHYFEQLQGPAYTPAQMELQQTQALDPLEQQRSATKQQIVQRLAAKGVQGGIVEKALQDVDRQFNQQRTGLQSGFANNAIAADKAQKAQAAQVGGALAATYNQQFGSDEARMLQALGLLRQIPEMANTNIGLANGVLQQQNPLALLQMLMQQQNQGSAQN